MAFCSNCGKELADNANFCNGCGQAVGVQPAQQPQPTQQPQSTYQQPQQVYPQPQQVYPQPQQVYPQAPAPVQQLSSKIKTDCIIWIVIASLQVIIGIINIIIGAALNADYEDGTFNIVSGVFVLFVAIINYIVAFRDSKYSKEILQRPVGISAKFSPIGGYIGNLIYNLLFGGLIGVIGSIYGLCIRNFVMTNKAAFDSIEAQYRQNGGQ